MSKYNLTQTQKDWLIFLVESIRKEELDEDIWILHMLSHVSIRSPNKSTGFQLKPEEFSQAAISALASQVILAEKVAEATELDGFFSLSSQPTITTSDGEGHL